MTVIEAWSYGIPVITTPAGGLPEVLQDGKNALVFDFGDYVMLSQKLEYLIKNYEQRAYMSEFEMKFVEQKFSLKLIIDCLSNIYTSLF